MSGLWLHFGDNYRKSTTKHAQFDQLVRGEDVSVLEGLRELTLRREQSCMRECFRQPDATLEDQAQWLVKYLALLRQFVQHADKWDAQLKADRTGFIWSSPLSTFAADARLSVRSVYGEEIMALHLYAALLQQQAYELASLSLTTAEDNPTASATNTARTPAAEPTSQLAATLSGLSFRGSFGRTLTSSDSTLGGASWHAAVVMLYRRAAGVLEYVARELYPTAVQAAGGFPAGDRPVELWEGAAEAMQALCLAQAQGVAAHRAEMRGTTPALVAALHRGAADMYEQASVTLRDIKAPPSSGTAPTASSPSISERLRRFLAISATLHEARALKALAECRRQEMELGQAVACLRDALLKAQRCLVVCERDEDWRAALQPELQQLAALQQAYEKERETVYLQNVPPAAPPLPPGKSIVVPLPYEPADCTDSFFL